MNVYDFDKTIYDGDSSMDFYRYCLKHYKKIIKLWPRQLQAYKNHACGKIDKTEMKTIFYEYFEMIPNIHDVVDAFWEEHERNIKSWYYAQRRDDDLIISASPEFLLQPICEKLNVSLIGSVVNPLTGENLKANCWGMEKVIRMNEYYEVELIDQFYSDSYSDDPLAQYAKEAFLVKGNEIKPW